MSRRNLKIQIYKKKNFEDRVVVCVSEFSRTWKITLYTRILFNTQYYYKHVFYNVLRTNDIYRRFSRANHYVMHAYVTKEEI